MTRVEIVDPEPTWPARYAALAADLRAGLGVRADRIDHIGSTAVAGLGAKDVIDIQVCVPDLDDPDVAPLITALGYTAMVDNPDRRKRFFHLDRDGVRVANLHVRRTGEFSAQAALLFRDHLRAVPAARARYETVKRSLAAQDWADVDAYADAKGDCVWLLLREADRWAWSVGWSADGA